MKNFLKGLIIFIVISIFAIIIPVKLVSELGAINVDSVSLDDGSTITENFNRYINTEDISTESKDFAFNIMQLNSELISKEKLQAYSAIIYLEVVLTVVILVLGIYLLKKINDKKYLGSSVIISSIVSMAWTIFLIISVYFLHLK